MPPSPQLIPTISFGQVLQIGILVFGIGAGYAMLSSQGEGNEVALRIASEERKSLEIRVRGLELQNARAQEQYSAIIGILSKMDARLERMEVVK